MDYNKIKERLAALRADDLDPDDPEVAELLMLVEEDLELAEWFAQEQVFDQAFAAKLQSIEAPEGLDEKIVSAMDEAAAPKEPANETPAPAPVESGPSEDESVEEQPAIEEPVAETSEVETPEEEPKPAPAPVAAEEPAQGTAVPFTPPPPRAWWQNPGLISAAAAIVLLAGFALLVFEPNHVSAQSDLDLFYDTIEGHHLESPQLIKHSDDLNVLRQFLREQGAPAPGELPATIDPMPEIGCTIIDFKGDSVTVVRMLHDEEVDLFVVRHQVFPHLEDLLSPNITDIGEVSVLTWSDGSLYYFLVHTGDLGGVNSLL